MARASLHGMCSVIGWWI